MLTAIILLPFLGALVITLLPGNYRFAIRIVALLTTLLSMLLAVDLFLHFNNAAAGVGGYKFVERIPWVDLLGISYFVGVDGINVGLIFLGAMVAFAAACVSWEIKTQEKLFYVLLFVMSGGTRGAFASLDLFFFYAFHEFALIPTFIMIGVWGRGENRTYATFNLTLYLSVGALLALAGLLALYLQGPAAQRTFDVVTLTEYFKGNTMPASTQHLIFPLLMFGFGILVSLWPFHTWAPLGYGAAPTATAMLHAGVLKKFGLDGLLRPLPFIGAALVMAMLAGCGLPGFANFVGELSVMFGAWKGSFGHAHWLVVASAWGGLVVGALYMLRAVRRVLHGELPEQWANIKDATPWRKLPFALLLASLLLFGCWPRLLTDKIKPSAEVILKMATGTPDKGPAP